MTGSVYLFAYGHLQSPEVQVSSFGRALQGAKDSMTGFRKHMIEITDPDLLAGGGKRFCPNLLPSDDPSDEVDGMRYAITDEELVAVDIYEACGYRREERTLKSGHAAWVYFRL